MTIEQIIGRKIFLKRQAVVLIKAEIWRLRLQWIYLKMRSILKWALLSGYCYRCLGLRVTQWLYNLIELKQD